MENKNIIVNLGDGLSGEVNIEDIDQTLKGKRAIVTIKDDPEGVVGIIVGIVPAWVAREILGFYECEICKRFVSECEFKSNKRVLIITPDQSNAMVMVWQFSKKMLKLLE